jgi:Inositolphosphorylceramide synthase subunit Kei1
MVRALKLKVPKLRNCLGCIDLKTATEVITIFTLINKVSGFYGILSLLTGTTIAIDPSLTSGAQISALQMSMYVWSIFGTIVCLWALKQIKDVFSGISLTAEP